MKLLLKIAILVLFNGIIFRNLYLKSFNTFENSASIIRSVHSKPNYKYWTRIDGTRFCNLDSLRINETFKYLEAFSDKKTNVLYLENVELADCLENIRTIASEFHRRNLELAINIEKQMDYKSVYSEDFTSMQPNYYREKFKNAGGVNDWVDYLVVDNAMEYMTFEDRRSVLVALRTVFPKPFIGFRFTKHFAGDPESPHQIRNNVQIKNFLPRDDDGDFIITSIKTNHLRRTTIFVEDEAMDKVGVDGEFVK